MSLLPHPKSLWAIWVVDEVTSPRVGGGPSRHQELGIKNTSAAFSNSSQAEEIGFTTQMTQQVKWFSVYLKYYVGVE